MTAPSKFDLDVRVAPLNADVGAFPTIPCTRICTRVTCRSCTCASCITQCPLSCF